MIFLLFAFLSFGQAADYGRVNVSALNVRSSPNMQNNKQCVAPNASELAIKQKQGNWYRVDVSKIKGCETTKEGWVYGSPLFKPESRFETAQVIKAPNGLRVRASESTDAEIKCNLKNGDHISVIGPSEKNPNWLRINTEQLKGCDGEEAFVHRDYIEAFRDYTYVEKNPPAPEGIDPVDGRETEGGTACLNCKANGVERSLYQDFTDYIYGTMMAAKTMLNKSMIESYSESNQVRNMIRCAKRNVQPDSTGYCYRYVKNALLGGKLSSIYLNGVPAKGAGFALQRQGYVNLLSRKDLDLKIDSAYDAPKGAILVYDGGEYGHIEIKTGDSGEGGFISDYYSESPRAGRVGNGFSGRGRTLIGVYVKDVGEGDKSDENYTCPRPIR